MAAKGAVQAKYRHQRGRVGLCVDVWLYMGTLLCSHCETLFVCNPTCCSMDRVLDLHKRINLVVGNLNEKVCVTVMALAQDCVLVPALTHTH